MRIEREEIFEPILSSITFTNEQEALEIANDSDYGLAAAVWIKNIDIAFKMSKNLRVELSILIIMKKMLILQFL